MARTCILYLLKAPGNHRYVKEWKAPKNRLASLLYLNAEMPSCQLMTSLPCGGRRGWYIICNFKHFMAVLDSILVLVSLCINILPSLATLGWGSALCQSQLLYKGDIMFHVCQETTRHGQVPKCKEADRAESQWKEKRRKGRKFKLRQDKRRRKTFTINQGTN